jgi:hypothetical protein
MKTGRKRMMSISRRLKKKPEQIKYGMRQVES